MPRKPDPTKAAIRYVKLVNKRMDDLREAYQKVTEKESYWIDKFADMRFMYEEKLTQKQSSRHDANEETLRVLIKNVQDTVTEATDRIIMRVSALELSQSQNTGKSSIWSNPIVLILISAIVGFVASKYFH